MVLSGQAPQKSTPSPRYCRKCALPMKGHKRPHGKPVCPIKTTATTESLPPSPPVTPLRTSGEKVSTSPTATFDASGPDPPFPTPRILHRELVGPSFVIPEEGPWHRRNPNWKEDTPSPEQPLSRAASLVPTVLVDEDGNTIQGSDDGNNPNVGIGDHVDSGGIDPFHASPRRPVEPVVCIYCIKHKDIERYCDEATEMEVYTDVIRSPVNSKGEAATRSTGTQASPTEDSWWLVTSRNAELVKLVVDSHKHRVPGAMKDLTGESSAVKLVTNFQLILTGVVGGCVALCMGSLLH